MHMGSLGGIAGSALNAFGVDMLVRANNIANVNTNGFHSQDLSLMTGPGGEGTLVGNIYYNTSRGPLVPGLVMSDGGGREVLSPGYVEGSNTDVAHEFVHMIVNQRSYEANAAVVRAYDQLSGTVLDMKI